MASKEVGTDAECACSFLKWRFAGCHGSIMQLGARLLMIWVPILGQPAREFVDMRGLEKPPEDLLLRRPRTVIMSVDGP